MSPPVPVAVYSDYQAYYYSQLLQQIYQEVFCSTYHQNKSVDTTHKYQKF